jgi:hypothetical protein
MLHYLHFNIETAVNKNAVLPRNYAHRTRLLRFSKLGTSFELISPYCFSQYQNNFGQIFLTFGTSR